MELETDRKLKELDVFITNKMSNYFNMQGDYEDGYIKCNSIIYEGIDFLKGQVPVEIINEFKISVEYTNQQILRRILFNPDDSKSWIRSQFDLYSSNVTTEAGKLVFNYITCLKSIIQAINLDFDVLYTFRKNLRETLISTANSMTTDFATIPLGKYYGNVPGDLSGEFEVDLEKQSNGLVKATMYLIKYNKKMFKQEKLRTERVKFEIDGSYIKGPVYYLYFLRWKML